MGGRRRADPSEPLRGVSPGAALRTAQLVSSACAYRLAVLNGPRSAAQRSATSRSNPVRCPGSIDIAANGRRLGLRGAAAGEHGIERCAEVTAVGGTPARARLIELAAVGQAALDVKDVVVAVGLQRAIVDVAADAVRVRVVVRVVGARVTDITGAVVVDVFLEGVAVVGAVVAHVPKAVAIGFRLSGPRKGPGQDVVVAAVTMSAGCREAEERCVAHKGWDVDGVAQQGLLGLLGRRGGKDFQQVAACVVLHPDKEACVAQVVEIEAWVGGGQVVGDVAVAQDGDVVAVGVAGVGVRVELDGHSYPIPSRSPPSASAPSGSLWRTSVIPNLPLLPMLRTIRA